MKHILALAMWTMLAGIVIVPIADHILAARSRRSNRRSASQNHEDWITWWILENHPSAKRARRRK